MAKFETGNGGGSSGETGHLYESRMLGIFPLTPILKKKFEEWPHQFVTDDKGEKKRRLTNVRDLKVLISEHQPPKEKRGLLFSHLVPRLVAALGVEEKDIVPITALQTPVDKYMSVDGWLDIHIPEYGIKHKIIDLDVSIREKKIGKGEIELFGTTYPKFVAGEFPDFDENKNDYLKKVDEFVEMIVDCLIQSYPELAKHIPKRAVPSVPATPNVQKRRHIVGRTGT